jgi:MscS family membrane protein
MRDSIPQINLAPYVRRYRSAVLLGLAIVLFSAVKAQTVTPLPVTPTAQAETPEDTLGRTTPRGAVLGFLAAAGKRDDETAAKYLNTTLRGQPAAELAQRLSVVLNQRLSAKLNQLSNRPEGSLADPLHPNIELVGTISSAEGDIEILLERVDRGKAGSIWLFSRGTLNWIPRLYDEVNAVPVENVLPAFLTETRIGPFPLFEVLAVVVGMPLFYMLASLLNALLSRLACLLHGRLRRKSALRDPQILPRPIRLFALAFFIRWMLGRVSLPLLTRQFWSSTATVIIIAASVWLFILLNNWFEKFIRVRLALRVKQGTASVVRLGCRVVDVLAILVGVLFVLHHFGVNPTAAVAGLGVGGIAIALAAQKTLENLFGGTSLILDRVMSVGDMVKIGDKQGTVEDVGLRSIRIRTLDRTMVSMPNGYIASLSLENFSIRDKFWFHQYLSLRKDTSSAQMRSFVEGATNLLKEHPGADQASVRVSLLSLSAFSLDLEIFAYIPANDWAHFLEMQGELLLRIMEILQAAGIQMAVQPHAVSVMTPTISDGNGAQTLAVDYAPDHRPVAASRQGTTPE